MKPPKCKPLQFGTRYSNKAVRSVHYDGKILSVEIQGEGFAYARVVFKQPVGFRILNEMDLTEFWKNYNLKNGWIYEVEEGGWIELESVRVDFTSPHIWPELREYLLVDENCISVICNQPPELVELGSDPQ